MIRPEQIPDEVAEAAWDALPIELSFPDKGPIRAAIVAAINAWPGAHVHEWQRPWLGGMSGTDLILPLTENTDAEA